MAYYLHHYFDPNFAPELLSPRFLTDSGSQQYYLGYVQNVVAGQVLAEIIDLDDNPDYSDYDPRFIYPERIFPCGPNCAPHPQNDSRIIATANGYCFYHQGLITVKKLLNVRRNVDLHTGNILFVGDVLAHGMIKQGFWLQGKNILVKDIIEGGCVISSENLQCESGIKGNGTAYLESGGNMRLPFCENATIKAMGNLEIDGSCMHSTLYIGGSVLIKGRLQGGTVYANNIVYVKEQLGGGQKSPTRISMGIDPMLIKPIKDLESKIEYYLTKKSELLGNIEKNPHLESVLSNQIKLLDIKVKVGRGKLNKMNADSAIFAENASQCRLICPGKIIPTIDLSIADNRELFPNELSSSDFRLIDGKITQRNITNI